jgi:pimeloyl-ACP methyl ester carboxylesterase
MQKIVGTYKGADGRLAEYDIQLPGKVEETKEIVVLMHGFMGFKDWGCWSLVQNLFVENGLAFCKFNVSHNGTTVESPYDFVDLKAFKENNYSKEIFDLEMVIQEMYRLFGQEIRIHLIGHSRGGGIVLLKASDNTVQSVVSWAGISSISDRFPEGEELEMWKKGGVREILNGRTHQKMPLGIDQYFDFVENKDRLNIQSACERINCPVLIIHGTNDSSVAISEGEKLAQWTKTELFKIENGDHTFKSKHPWEGSGLPEDLLKVAKKTIEFIKSKDR